MPFLCLDVEALGVGTMRDASIEVRQSHYVIREATSSRPQSLTR
jgi:hypothetical protein